MTKSTNTSTAYSNPSDLFAEFMDQAMSFDPWPVLEPILSEAQDALHQRTEDWMSFQQEAQQTVQTIVKEQGAQVLTGLQSNIQEGIEFTQTMAEAHQAMFMGMLDGLGRNRKD